jgi:hypothetical protein
VRVDRTLGTAFAVLALLFLLLGVETIPDDWQTQTGAQYFVVGPKLFPRIAGALCLLLAVLLVLRPDGRHALDELRQQGAGLRVLGVLAICIGYVVLIGLAGFRIATVAMVAAFLVTFGVRRPLTVAAFALAVAFGVGFVFEHLFGIFLPEPVLDAVGL